MRLLALLVLFAPSLFAIDLDNIDRDTLRYVRLALLKDEVRAHFGLRIGEYESLDQALSTKLGGSPLLILRQGDKAAAVVIDTDKVDTAGAHLFFNLEERVEAQACLDQFVAVTCLVTETGSETSRLLRLKDDKLQLCHTWTSAEESTLEGGRYVIRTRRTLQAGPVLAETTEYLLDGTRVDGGLATRSTTLDGTAEGLSESAVTESPISVSAHCSIARRLERDGFNEAALYHANAALAQAKLDALSEDDGRCLEAQALCAKLEARLRPAVVEK